MLNPTTSAPVSERPIRGWPLGIAAILLFVLYAIGAAVRGELGQIMVASAQTVPFVILASLAYLGVGRTWGKVLALIWLGLLVAGIGIGSLAMSFAALLEGPVTAAGQLPTLVPGAGPRLLAVALGSFFAMCIGALGFIPAVRVWLSRYIPIDPASFVQMIALVAVVALTLLCYIPLVALGAPPLLNLIATAGTAGGDLTAGRSDTGMLLDTIYGLLWTVPGAILAVGYAIRRNLREALVRLGLVRPTGRQVLAAVGLAALLVVVATGLGYGVDLLWDQLGWAKTDNEAFGQLLDFAMNPIGAVVIGVTAGLGEELAVRGVLQPRLGILLSNLFFISLHAFQYNWNTLIVIFVVGLSLGIIRKRTNTTTSAIVHGLYDFILIILSVYHVPGF